MAFTYFTVASFNVRNLISAGVTYYGRNRYSEGAYEAKLAWLTEQLFRMDADVVALQETFDLAPIEDLVARHAEIATQRLSKSKANRARYKHVWHLPNLDSTDDEPLPGVAIISRRRIVERHAVQDLADDPIEIEPDEGLSYRLTRMSRPLQIARIDLGEGLQGWVLNAHLKSKRPTYPDGSAAADPTSFDFFGRAQGSFRSLARRAGEALALRREALAKLEGGTDPVFVIGDLNDEIGAVTTEMIAGEMPWRGWPFEVRERYWGVELYSAARAHLRRTEESSIYTHIFNGHYGTLDHVLVSQHFYYRNPDRIGEVNFVQVSNDHLVDGSLHGAPSLGPASDHGQVVVRLSIDTDRLVDKPRGEFEVTRDADGAFRFVLRATNGAVIAESQAYKTRAAAMKGIQSVRANAWRATLDDQT